MIRSVTRHRSFSCVRLARVPILVARNRGTSRLSPGLSPGNLYGTTTMGGAYKNSCGANCGTVFQLTPAAGGTWTEKVLHSFGKGKDGASPYAGLILDAAGNLYGTTSAGGADNSGTVFEITP